MIQYALKCADGHSFDSWFQSASAFDKLQQAEMVTCSVCGSTRVEKELMAPSVGRGGGAARESAAQPESEGEGPGTTPGRGVLSQARAPADQALARLRQHVERNSDYVGDRFAQEARAIHSGDAPERMIHGEARAEDARALIEEGVNVAPLPFASKTRSN